MKISRVIDQFLNNEDINGIQLNSTLKETLNQFKSLLFIAASVSPFYNQFVKVKQRDVWLGEFVISESIKVE